MQTARHPSVKRLLVIACLGALWGLLGATPVASAAGREVPFGFVGAMADGPMLSPGFDPGPEMALMTKAGLETVRVPFHWNNVQPYASFDEVPVGRRGSFREVDGRPTSFAVTDRMVEAAARRGMRLLPVVTLAPSWARKNPGLPSSPPAGTANYARYARALVRRYGSNGDFWRENPHLRRAPIRNWQIWNEPNQPGGWADDNWASGYVKLLRAGRRAIKQVDPKSRIVLAGIVNQSWRDLRLIYRQRGARRLFDTAAVHPYTATPSGVLEIIKRFRRTMALRGDRRKPVRVTEWSWPSSRGKVTGYGWETTERGQARLLPRTLRLLAARRRQLRIQGVNYYTWLGEGEPSGWTFDYAGVRELDASGRAFSKPAHASLRRTALRLEGCALKSANSTRCARRRR